MKRKLLKLPRSTYSLSRGQGLTVGREGPPDSIRTDLARMADSRCFVYSGCQITCGRTIGENHSLILANPSRRN